MKGIMVDQNRKDALSMSTVTVLGVLIIAVAIVGYFLDYHGLTLIMAMLGGLVVVQQAYSAKRILERRPVLGPECKTVTVRISERNADGSVYFESIDDE